MRARPDPRYALILACFGLSGFAALLYQTVWTRELSFVFGTSELAVAAVLAAYMGGLALGAGAAARLNLQVRRPVRVYGLLELAIALSALAVPAAIRGLNALYVGWLGGADELPELDAGIAWLQLAAAFAVLLPPTAFMGATLPLLARHAVRREAEIGARIGGLYAVNTAGAIAGTLCAAFWLMPELGLRRTVWVGAALNLTVFALAVALARGAAPAPPVPAAPGRLDPAARWLLPAMALSGAVSFVYEVLWTRLLGHLLGASLQAFATMLASFLLGIALGSALAARVASTRARARAGFALAQLGIAATSLAAFAFADRLPELARHLGAGIAAPGPSAALAVATLLPITLCVGATFPFAVRALARAPEEAAGVSARVYAWNTVGAIAGALGAGFVLLPGLGFAGTLALAVAANLALAALAGMAAPPRRALWAGAAAALALVLLLAPPRTPWSLLLHSSLEGRAERGERVFSAVGRSSTVVLQDRGLHLRLATNGLPEALIDRADVLRFPVSLAHWLGLLPSLLRPDARELLVIGLGGGRALESVPSTVERIDVIELEPEVLAANRAAAGERARDPLADPRVRVHLGDARGALQLSGRRYGAIVSQPSHPWTAGASHLYTREFFDLVRRRLAPDGVFVQWIGMQFVDESLLRSLVAALVEVFGHVEIYWLGDRGLLFAASPQPVRGLEGARRALARAPEDYARYGLHRLEHFASAWALGEEGAAALAAGASPNSDDENRLAARAAGLGSRALDPDAAGALFARSDPLRAALGQLERGALVEALVARGERERATALAGWGNGLEAALGRGRLDLELGRPRNAARHYARARALAPDSAEAWAGAIAARRGALLRGPLPDLDEAVVAKVDPRLTAWLGASRAAEQGAWQAVRERDGLLARIEPGHPLFEDAARLRIDARLALGAPGAGAEAMALAEPLLSRRWRARDSLRYARAAARAGRTAEAWAPLQRLADRARPGETSRAPLREALDLLEDLDALPPERRDPLRAQLERLLAR